MARVLNPITIPSGVDVTIADKTVMVQGSKGKLEHTLNPLVSVAREDDVLKFVPKTELANAIAQTGTARALVNNMLQGVSCGFERKLELVGVGYRAQSQGKVLNLTLGYSHPVKYVVPEGITIETPTQTEILVKGCDKRLVGQVAADIRSFRTPEPYKGKGVKYADEVIVRKEAKKK